MNVTPQHAALKLLPLPYLAESLQYFHTIAAQLPMPLILQSDITTSSTTCKIEPRGRFDIITAAPEYWLQTHNGQIDWHGSIPGFAKDSVNSDSLSILHDVITEILASDIDYSEGILQELPFCGGMIGYCSYDLAREYISQKSSIPKDIDIPDMQFGFYGWACIQDHAHQKSWLVIHPQCEPALSKNLPNLLVPRKHTQKQAEPQECQPHFFSSNISKQQYSERFTKIQEYIHAGDCYQINLAQRFSSKTSQTATQLYEKLRTVMPSPFCALIPIYGNKDNAIISFSPERFVQLTTDGTAISQPIKGTSARHTDLQQDKDMALALQQDPKNLAENLMIVDLLRNDFGKACETGSITVKKLFELQTFANVHHLVSTIEGKLKSEYNGADLLKACFPGGSITGAPKVRAMQIIDELEPHRRSIYCGSIVMYSAHGTMDSNIMIRTLLLKDKTLFCWGGGGIVADSECDSEYQESFTKIKNLLDAINKKSE